METDNSIEGYLRHLGSLIAGILITRGWLGSEYAEVIIGLVVVTGTMLLAAYRRKQAARIKAATVAVALDLPAGASEGALNRRLQESGLPPVPPLPSGTQGVK